MFFMVINYQTREQQLKGKTYIIITILFNVNYLFRTTLYSTMKVLNGMKVKKKNNPMINLLVYSGIEKTKT